VTRECPGSQNACPCFVLHRLRGEKKDGSRDFQGELKSSRQRREDFLSPAEEEAGVLIFRSRGSK